MIGDRIVALREQMGISQAELARRSEVSKGYLNMIEHNRVDSPGLYVVRDIGLALGVSVDDLLAMDMEVKPCPECGGRGVVFIKKEG